MFRLQIDPPEGGQFSLSDSIGGMAISPDGRTAAFVATIGAKTGLWVRALDGTTARLIAGIERAAHPFWSPDSKSIGFFAAGKLQRVDLAGGGPLSICDAPAARGGAWTADGRILFGVVSSGLMQVSASGGVPSPLTTLDASRGDDLHFWPQMLPGGRFLYLVRSVKPENSGTYAASLANPAEHVRLLSGDNKGIYAAGPGGKSYLLWLRGGALVAQEFDPGPLKLAGEPHAVAEPVGRVLGQALAAASANGVLLYSASSTESQFVWMDRGGNRAGTVGDPGEYTSFSLSPDGRRAIATRRRAGGNDFWMLDAERGVGSLLTGNAGAYPVWAPDSRTVVYNWGTPRNLFRKEVGGAGTEERVAQAANIQNPTDWSRDARWILYFAIMAPAGMDLWVLPVTPEGKPSPESAPKLYLGTKSNESYGRFSPESPPRWVAYQSDETGRYEVYIQAFPEPRGAVRISTAGGQYPQWGPGGSELFYVSPDNKLMAVSLKFSADSVEASVPHELFALPGADIGWSRYEAAPDGQRFLVRATPGQAGQPLTVIVNWPALLKKEAAQ